LAVALRCLRNALKASVNDVARHLTIALRKVLNSRENAAAIGV
jgi:hypothetical protein